MKLLRLAALIVVMAALPAVAFAQSTDTTAKAKHPAKVATTTMSGVVKSVDDSSMVMTRSNAKGPEQTFHLNASTTRKGKLVPGDVVNVQYFLDHGQKVATVVTVTKPPKSKPGK